MTRPGKRAVGKRGGANGSGDSGRARSTELRSSRGGLRRRLSKVLIVAALVPVVLVSSLAAVLVRSSIGERMRLEAMRGLDVAHSLMLRQLHAVAAQAATLGDHRDLLDAVTAGGAVLQSRLAAAARDAGAWTLIEVANATGDVMMRCAAAGCSDVAGAGPLADLHSTDRSPSILRALAFERTASIEPTRRFLAMRAAMPLADQRLALVGVVVVSAPLDGPFIDRLKAALGSERDVLLYSGTEPSVSSLIASSGERLMAPALPEEARADGTNPLPVSSLNVGDQALAVGFGRILDADARTVGRLGVAINREPLNMSGRRAASALALGVLVALALAMVLARVIGLRLTKAIDDLHAGALAVARGDLGAAVFPVAGDDEFGRLADAFRTMTRSLSEKQKVLSARARELRSLYRLGRALTSITDVDAVVERAADGACAALDARLVAVVLADLDGGVPRVAVRGIDAGAGSAQIVTALRKLPAPRAPRVARAGQDDEELGTALRAAGLAGPVLVAPLTLRAGHAGMILVLTAEEAPAGSAELELLVTISDQIAAALDGAQSSGELKALQHQVEQEERERTAELERANAEAERAARELGEAQAQIVETEQAVGSGALAAEMAAVMMSATEAATGVATSLSEAVRTLQERTGTLLRLPGGGIDRYLAALAATLPALTRSETPPAAVRRELQRQLAERLEGVESADEAAGMLAPLGKHAEALLPVVVDAYGGDGVHELCAHAAAVTRVVRLAQRLKRSTVWLRVGQEALRACLTAGERSTTAVDAGAALDDAAALLGDDPEGAPLVERAIGALPPVAGVPGEVQLLWAALLSYIARVTDATTVVVGAGAADDTIAFTLDCPGIPLDAGARARLAEAVRTRACADHEMVDPSLLLAARLAARQGGEIELEGDGDMRRFVVRLPLQGGGPS